jgi:hypothetical protein
MITTNSPTSQISKFVLEKYLLTKKIFKKKPGMITKGACESFDKGMGLVTDLVFTLAYWE